MNTKLAMKETITSTARLPFSLSSSLRSSRRIRSLSAVVASDVKPYPSSKGHLFSKCANGKSVFPLVHLYKVLSITSISIIKNAPPCGMVRDRYFKSDPWCTNLSYFGSLRPCEYVDLLELSRSANSSDGDRTSRIPKDWGREELLHTEQFSVRCSGFSTPWLSQR